MYQKEEKMYEKKTKEIFEAKKVQSRITKGKNNQGFTRY